MTSTDNPCGLEGFAFLEFSGPDAKLFDESFLRMGFHLKATHENQKIRLYEQGDILFIVNATEDSQAHTHASVHGAGTCAMGFKVRDAKLAYQYALAHGATPFNDSSTTPHDLLGIEAIGGSVIYFVEDVLSAFQTHWQEEHSPNTTSTPNLTFIDHLTHNVYRGQMDKWADFYHRIFNFSEIRFFNIEGQLTGLTSRALSSPCGKIKIPLNESKDDQSQIEEFLHEFGGEGIQHVALGTQKIHEAVEALRGKGVQFLDVPDTYYEMIDARIPWHQEPLDALKKNRILIDGEQDPAKGLLLQIFTENLFGPVFFEIIQRRGNQGFGEGNFQALFEAIERDQIKRGTLSASSSQ